YQGTPPKRTGASTGLPNLMGMTDERPHSTRGCPLNLGDATASRKDFLLGGAGERVRAHLHRNRDLAGAQHLDGLVLAHRALGDQALDGDLAALGVQLAQPVQVHDLVDGLEPGVAEALQLGDPADERHLAALEADRDRAARLGALGTATGGLALGRLATALAGLGLVRARGRTQVVDLEQLARGVALAHQLTSSTVTRCATTLICPRTSGRSSRTTDLPIRPRPRESSVARCLRLPPIVDRTCVIFSFAMAYTPALASARARSKIGRAHV